MANGPISNAERGIALLIHKFVESKVKKHLGYNPLNASRTEFYPRARQATPAPFEGIWDVNSSHTQARLERIHGDRETLQLEHLPVRSIENLYVDDNGQFGTASGSFPSSSEWTEGEDFWPEYDAAGYCRSGLLIASGSWPTEPGSVKVVYTAGYTRAELDGEADSIDASGIVAGVTKSMMASFQKWKAMKTNSRIGFGAALKSERLQDYSYTLTPQTESMLSMVVTIPSEALDDLEEYRHFGLMRT